MSSGLVNVNLQSNPYYNTLPVFSSLSGSTTSPNAPIPVLNQNDPTYKNFSNGFNSDLLNPNQNDKNLLGRGYYTISTAYGQDPTQIYSTRGCAM
jgi:hypothetical protein